MSCPSVLSEMLVYCGQTVRWINMPLGAEVGLDPGDIAVKWIPSPLRESGTAAPPLFDTTSFRPMFIAKRSPWISANCWALVLLAKSSELCYILHSTAHIFETIAPISINLAQFNAVLFNINSLLTFIDCLIQSGTTKRVIFGSRPSDHYFRGVCWFVCLFDCLCRVFLSRLWSDIDQTRMCHMSESSCVP